MRKPLVYLIALLGSIGAAGAAPINVDYTVAAQGSSFLYEFSVNDVSVPDLLSVTLTLPSAISTVTNLAAPSGFSIFFDGGSYLLDLVEDTSGFTVGETTGGFRLVSPLRFGVVPFSALSLDSNQNLLTTAGSTVETVPEPRTWALLVSGAFVLFAFRRRERIA